jgi:aminomethyltransferase
MVYRIGDEQFLVVVNAAGREGDLAWFRDRAKLGVAIDPLYDGRAMIAVQGPDAVATVDAISPDDLAEIPRFGIRPATVAGRPALVARTGYTGEDGFELFLAAADAEPLWGALLDAGVVPCGLGARDTLRLEAALPLYGNDIDRTTNPFEAGLGWTVKLDKPDFVGKAALVEAKQRGPTRRLIGFQMEERGIARHGYPICVDDHESVVTSGSFAPTIDAAIGMAYLPIDHTAAGTPVSIVIRDKPVAARIVPRPFYRRAP